MMSRSKVGGVAGNLSEKRIAPKFDSRRIEIRDSDSLIAILSITYVSKYIDSFNVHSLWDGSIC